MNTLTTWIQTQIFETWETLGNPQDIEGQYRAMLDTMSADSKYAIQVLVEWFIQWQPRWIAHREAIYFDQSGIMSRSFSDGDPLSQKYQQIIDQYILSKI